MGELAPQMMFKHLPLCWCAKQEHCAQCPAIENSIILCFSSTGVGQKEGQGKHFSFNRYCGGGDIVRPVSHKLEILYMNVSGLLDPNSRLPSGCQVDAGMHIYIPGPMGVHVLQGSGAHRGVIWSALESCPVEGGCCTLDGHWPPAHSMCSSPSCQPKQPSAEPLMCALMHSMHSVHLNIDTHHL